GHPGAWRPDYGRVQIPVLCLTSESYHSQGLWLKSRLRGMELETWASDGHALFADDPAAFNEKLRAFLGSIGFPGAPE
ncbi:MAG TPA: hypothetical protein VFR02_03660, partial [bacterium]|nr:hypothetical protein [bacterium]